MARTRAHVEPLAVRYPEAAAMLGVSASTLREWVSTGRVRPPYQVADRIQLFDVDQLREDWDKLKSGAGADDGENPWDEVLEQ
jgi:hypothetical protein